MVGNTPGEALPHPLTKADESLCLERTPSWPIEFQRESLNHAIADPATGADQSGLLQGRNVRLASLASPHHTTHHTPHTPPSHSSPHGWSISPGPATSAVTPGRLYRDLAR